ncbi:MAG: T9SS type A sorting domain-containing protein [Saprospiraceae bacterium]
MKKSLLLFVFAALFFSAGSQELPDVGIELPKGNYFAICERLDAHFVDYEQEDTDCWDNQFVKYQRWKWFWKDRVMPDGSFPDLKTQWVEQQKARAKVASRGNQPQWEEVGPTQNTGGGYWGMGRTKHVAFHSEDPYTFFVGAPDGGLWKTEDGGLSYIPLGDELPYLPVSIILTDPSDPDVLYISLGDKFGWWHYNMGVYKSEDGGVSWNPTGLSWELDDFKVIYELKMDPNNSQVLVAATNSGLLKSTDGGATWVQKRAGEFTDVKFRPGDSNTLYAAFYDYWGQSDVFKSIDGGETWDQITSEPNTNNSIKLAVTMADPDVLGIRYSQDKKLFMSSDAGATIEFRSYMPEDFQFYISQINPDIVYCANVVVNQSTNGGANWTQITNWYNNGIQPEVHADVHDIVVYPYNPEILFFCNDGGVYTYHEPYDIWSDYSNGMGIAQFYRISVSEAGSLKIAAGSQDNGGWLRFSGGNWIHTNGGDAMTQAIDPYNSNILFTEYYGGNAIYRSTNNWGTNTTISDNLPDDPEGAWVTPFVMNPLRTETMLFGFHDIYKTFDRGDHFHKISTNLTGSTDNNLRDVIYAPQDTNIILASWSNKVYRTDDGGASWSTLNTPDPSNEITRIAIDPNDDMHMWVCKAGYGDNKKVYQSAMLGNLLIWQNISNGLPNVPVNAILYDEETNFLFVGTDIGVYYTDADEINWQVFGEGLPNVYVFDLKVRAATRTLYIGTHGRGVWSADLTQLPVGTETLADSGQRTKLYPNPASSRVYFNSANPHRADFQLRVMDVHGRQVLEQNWKNQAIGELSFSTQFLSNGIYYVELRNAAGEATIREKLVVAH